MLSAGSVILRFDQKAIHKIGHTQRVSGFVKIRHLIPVISALDLDANPRESKVGPITNAIRESLDRTPDTFPSKTKGLLVGCSNYSELERNRFELRFQDSMIEGILDGGHNVLAIGLHILEKCGTKDSDIRKIKRWQDFRAFWNARREEIEQFVRGSDDPNFDILVPVELLVPASMDQEDVDEFSSSLLDICAARNNNAQLKAETKANQSGYFDTLKEVLPAELSKAVEWKTNDGGRIKAADVIALAWIPLSVFEKLPEDEDGRKVEAPVPQNIYRSKGDCVTRFERLMSSPEVTLGEDGEYRRELISEPIRSALELTGDVIRLFDLLYARFPEAHNANGGKFASISVIKKMNPSNREPMSVKTKFFRHPVNWSIPEGFIVPLVYGLRSLIDIGPDGLVMWKVDPFDFLEDKLQEIAGDHSGSMAMLDYDPQKVGKSPTTYRFAERAFDSALLQYKASEINKQQTFNF